jgi:hypothetical protein
MTSRLPHFLGNQLTDGNKVILKIRELIILYWMMLVSTGLTAKTLGVIGYLGNLKTMPQLRQFSCQLPTEAGQA